MATDRTAKRHSDTSSNDTLRGTLCDRQSKFEGNAAKAETTGCEMSDSEDHYVNALNDDTARFPDGNTPGSWVSSKYIPKKYVVCKFCGASFLAWSKTDESTWRLVNAYTRELHVCKHKDAK